jgi:hypothetical protein
MHILTEIIVLANARIPYRPVATVDLDPCAECYEHPRQ